MPPAADKTSGSWRDLQQGGQRGKTTKVARQRKLLLLLRGSLVLLVLSTVVTGILAIRYFLKAAEEAAPAGPLPPLEVSFQSNGVLTTEWFRATFAGMLHDNVRQIDVSALKDAVEARGQVATASVTVSLPSLLSVSIEEREPVLRLRVKGAGGAAQTLLIARDGTIYEGACYPAETLRRLPGAAGLRVRNEGSGYARINGLDPVVELLDIAQSQLPALYRHWRVIDLSDWNPESGYRPSLIRVTSSHIEKIVFSTDNIAAQIERLSGILDHLQRNQLAQPKSIDLSFGEEAVIRYK